MLEIRITAPELAEAMNNLARAIGLATTTQNGETSGATPTSTTSVSAEESTLVPTEVPVAPAEVTSTPPQAVLPLEATQAAANPTIPVSAPQTVPVAQPTQNVSSPSPAPIVPTAAPQYTLDMLANAGATLINEGKMSSVMAILAKFGVEALTSLPPDKYGAVALELRALGAQI